jgi:hypothetical protein
MKRSEKDMKEYVGIMKMYDEVLSATRAKYITTDTSWKNMLKFRKLQSLVTTEML